MPRPEMREISELQRRALQAGGTGCWTWDADSGRVSLDERAAATLGLPPSLPTIEAWTAAIHVDDRQKWSEILKAALAFGGEGIFNCECRVFRPGDHHPRWIATNGCTEFRDGSAVRMYGVLRDVTELRQASFQLEELTSRLSGIVSIAADAIISVDQDQRILMFNDGAEIIFGYGRDEVIGKPLTVLMPDRFQAAHGAHVRTFGAGTVQSRRMGERGAILGQRKSGETFPAEASISRVMVAGTPFYTAVLRDITERKQSEEVLERRIATATQDLRLEMRRREESQAQLLRTQRMEAFGQLTGGLAHDFNNLLTVIIGNLELLEMRLQDEKSRILLQRAQDAAGMGSRLTTRLLTFARRRSFEAAPLNVNEVVIGMAELLERSLGEHITLATSLEPAPWTVIADASEVENAVLNLALNARDAMPGGGKLFIETANVHFEAEQSSVSGTVAAGDYVRLTVSDTGCGMSEDVQRQAFEPFFTTKEPGKGTGLGLSTIYGFIEQAKGAVKLQSEVGLGTTINLYLPQADGEVIAPNDLHESAFVPRATGERVLLVEDNADVRVAINAQLESLGYVVVMASNGPDAIHQLTTSGPFALVMSDVVMSGGMSGFDVMRWIQANTPDIRIVLASGYPDAVLRSEAAAELQPKILRKPFNRSELARALRRALAV